LVPAALVLTEAAMFADDVEVGEVLVPAALVLTEAVMLADDVEVCPLRPIQLCSSAAAARRCRLSRT